MPKRSRKVQKKKNTSSTVSVINYTQPKRDENQSAFDALQAIIARTEETGEKNPLAVALGRLGGLKGGKARAEKLTAKERAESASKAAKARWAGKRTNS